MKRRSVIGIAAILLVAVVLAVVQPVVLGFRPNIKSGAAVLMDMDSGEIWLNVNGNVAMAPASVSKIMTELIVLDLISAGRSHWDERVPVSVYASSVGGATLSLKQGESYSLRELFEGITIYSANDAAIALAEHLAGSEPSFVMLMNEKARSLGLSSSTIFGNASGLSIKDLGPNRPPGQPSAETMMTASDAAKLAAALIRSHPEVLNTSSKTQMRLKEKGLYVTNTNSMLPAMGGAYAYEGTDGLKTGYDIRTGYCFAGTAHRKGQRLVAVVMGSKTSQERFEEMSRLFDYGFYLQLSPGEKFKHILQTIGSVLG